MAKHRSDGHEAPSSTLSMMALLRLEAEGQRWQRNCRLSIVKNVRLKKQDLVKPGLDAGAKARIPEQSRVRWGNTWSCPSVM